MTAQADTFVGLLAVSLGAMIIGGGVMRWQWYSDLPKFGWLEAKFGLTIARILNTTIGAVIIALGCWILL